MGKFVIGIFLCSVLMACKSHETTTSTSTSPQFLETQKYHEAVRAYLKGDYTSALGSSNEVLKINPKNDANLYLLSKIYFDQENWQESSKYLLMAGEADPENHFIATEIGYMYSATGNYAKAGQTYEALTQRFPYESEHYFACFENYMKCNDHKSALRVLSAQEKNTGVSIELYLNKYRIYQAQNQMAKACAILEKGLLDFSAEVRLLAPLIDSYLESNNTEKAMTLLKQLCSADAENGYARYLYGNYLLKTGSQEEGQRLLNESIELKGLSTDQKAEILLNNHKSFGCTTENKDITRAFLQQNPQAFVACTLNGDLMMQCDEPFSALSYYMQALSINPNAYPVWNPVLMISYREDIWDSLYNSSSRCIEFFPLQPFPYLMQGIALYKLGKTLESKGALELGENYVVDNRELELQFRAYQALVSASSNNTNLAIASLGMLFQKAPKNYILKAEVAENLLSYPACVTFVDSLINDCIQHDPQQGYFMALKAKQYLTQGRFSQAVEWIEKAMDSNYPIRFGLEFQGDIAMMKGDKTQANYYWKEAKVKGNHSLRLRDKYHE